MNGEEERPDVVERGPVLLEDVEADVAVVVDVRVKARRGELHLRGLVGVTGGELQAQLELVSCKQVTRSGVKYIDLVNNLLPICAIWEEDYSPGTP